MLRNVPSLYIILLVLTLTEVRNINSEVNSGQVRQNLRYQIPRDDSTNRIVRNENVDESGESLSSSDGAEDLEDTQDIFLHKNFGETETPTTHPRWRHANAIVKEPIVQDCPGCRRNQDSLKMDQSELSAEELRNLRLENIKKKILKKLRLKEPPNVSGLNPLPDPFLSATYHHGNGNRHLTPTASNDMDDYYSKTEQVIVFAEEGNGGGSSICQLRRSMPSVCLTFTLPQEVAKEKADLRATSAELWVYTFEEDASIHRVYTIAEVSTSEHYHGIKTTSLDPRHTLNRTDGWEAMNVSTTVGAWMNKTLHFRMDRDRDYPPLTLQIGCRNCKKVSNGSTSPINISEPQFRPFLVINMAEKIQKNRRRRNTNCHNSGSTECCRESFRVSFRQIGWNWIERPDEFDAYYCRGRCGGLSSQHHHTSAIQAQVNTQNRTATAAEAEAMIPCCTPKKLSGISIIVRITNNTSEIKHLPNMVVDSCGCAGEQDIS